MFQKLPSDPWFENLDPVLKLWMFESWVQDLEEKNEFERSFTILGGSFHNPEMAKKMIKQDQEPDFQSTQTGEEFDRWSSDVLSDEPKKKKRRKIING